jgi:phage/plasmid-like protein (TIGR03299 family)
MFSVREMPWHGLGVVLDKHPKTIEEAITAAGLDWEVAQCPVAAILDRDEDGSMTVDELTGYMANIRSDTGKALGIVSKRYQPVQNRTAFSFLAGIFGSEMHFETAGSLMGGRRVWVLMKIPSWIEVGGDPIGQYSFISNSHDGKSSVLAAVTPVRIVCANTEAAALRLAKGVHAQRTYTLRHLGDMDQKIADARNVMQVTTRYYESFKTVGDKLATVKLSERRAKTYIEKLLPIGEGTGDRAARNRQEARDTVLRILKGEGEGGNTSGNAPGTVWTFYNSAVEYADWYRSEKKEGGRFQRALDDPDGFKNHAWELSLDMAGMLN